MKPSRQCSQPGSLKPGEALESGDKVKPVNARKHRESEPSHTRLLKAGAKKGRQSSPGCLTWPGAHSEHCRCSRADLNPLVSNAEHGKAVSPGHAVRGHPNRKAGKRSQHGEDRRSQGRCVIRRICPRRSGLSWQENKQNHREEGKANGSSARN